MNDEVDVLGSPSLSVREVSVDVKQHCTLNVSEPRSCVKVEVDVLGSPSLISSPYDLCGRNATLNSKRFEPRNCVKVEVDVLGSPSLSVRAVSVDVKQH